MVAEQRHKSTNEWCKTLVSVFFGAALSFISTVGYSQFQEWRLSEKMEKIEYRRLLAEMRDNLKLDQLMELQGTFNPYELEEWNGFVGSDAYYHLPLEVRKNLDIFYSRTRLINSDRIKIKTLEHKKYEELKVLDIAQLAIPFLNYLKERKIVPNDEKLTYWDSREFGFSYSLKAAEDSKENKQAV